eukprot:CAMPEP_0202712790 /NCGR_PEP_ID=MMETSP1385-20130828/45778_1 /ASSEMBLY_ACC=CAM_ASM_000861 /TAXON_ID=933848 /ORGANISM="Elphidium margaritaceum" /LENGTH=510 /DNA_ID=CAMNT_0049372949 /DNA_START=88 /DNA_END=1620 /DNA_ORIENTATION=-
MQEKLTEEVELGDHRNVNAGVPAEEMKQVHIDMSVAMPMKKNDAIHPHDLSGNEDFEELGHGQHQHQHDLDSTSLGTWSKYKIMTWNLWCIPVSSPRTLSNPDRCSSYLHDLAHKQEWHNYDGLIVVALQELWCWKTGLFPPFLLRVIALFEYIPYIGRCVSALFQIISILLGVLPILKCLPIQYDPKPRFFHKLRRFLPFSFRDSNIPVSSFMDNGLALLFNKEPTQCGCHSYNAAACDDSLANKGWIYAYFEAQKLLVVNTHMQAAGAGHERLLQIRELKMWLYTDWESKGLLDKCIVLGDFNVDMESHPRRLEIYNESQKKRMLFNHQHEHDDEEKSPNAHDDDDDDEDADMKIDHGDCDLQIAGDANNCALAKDRMSQDLVSVNQTEIALKINAEIDEELGNDALTCLQCAATKESLADNLRKLRMAAQDGTKTKFTKKAYINIPHYLGSSFHKLNRYEPTFKRAEYNIDHIFANFECKSIKNHLLALGRNKMSDHRLVVSEFVAD